MRLLVRQPLWASTGETRAAQIYCAEFWKFFKENVGRHLTDAAPRAVSATLTRSQALRVAIMAQDGLSRAIRPAHTPFDGDTIFVLATGNGELGPMPAVDVARLG